MMTFSLPLALLFSAAAASSGPYHVIERIPGPDGAWDYASVDTVNNRVLVGRGGKIMSVDLTTKAVNGDFAAAAGAHAAIAVHGGAEVLITNGQANTVTFVDGKSGRLLATLPTGKGPDAASVDPSSGQVLVMDHAGGDVTLIDPVARTVVGTIAVGGTLEAAAVDGDGRAFVNVEDHNEVAVLDLKARRVIARYRFEGCEGPTGIAYAPADKMLITTCDGVAEIFKAATGKLVASIKTGDGADGVAFDTRQKLAFVPAGESGTMSVISIANGKAGLVGVTPTQTRARTIALDPRNGRVYLPTARSVPAVAGTRPAVAPGSFELLVLDR